MKSKNHINCRCNCNDLTDKTIFGMPPRSGKSMTTVNYGDYMNKYGHYQEIDGVVESIRKTIEKEIKNQLNIRDEPTEDKSDNMSGVRIKKTDEMTLEEFKENTRAYDRIIFNINKEKFDKFEKEYGVEPFIVSGVTGYSAVLINGVIEFKEKAIRIKETGYESKIIPYYFIDKVTGIYYIQCED